MGKISVIACAITAAAGIAATSSAGFVGFSYETGQMSGGLYFCRLYVQFDSADDVLLEVNDFNGLESQTWHHADFAGVSWDPKFASNWATDSFVTIGNVPGFSNSTAANAPWGGPGFNQPSVPHDASWFNANPQNLQGKADDQLRTLIGQFVSATPQSVIGSASIEFNHGLGTPVQIGAAEFNSVPTPGVFTAFILASLGARRRRVA
jgi:hypothetical protein